MHSSCENSEFIILRRIQWNFGNNRNVKELKSYYNDCIGTCCSTDAVISERRTLKQFDDNSTAADVGGDDDDDDDDDNHKDSSLSAASAAAAQHSPVTQHM